MKKTYIEPKTRIVPLLSANTILSGSTFTQEVGAKRGLSRENNSAWDDEEKEENTGGWFQ